MKKQAIENKAVARIEASKARWIGVLKCNSDDQETVRMVQKHIDKLNSELKFYTRNTRAVR